MLGVLRALEISRDTYVSHSSRAGRAGEEEARTFTSDEVLRLQGEVSHSQVTWGLPQLLSGAGAGARARAAASRARRAPVWRAAGGSEVVGCGVCAASAVAGAAARRAGGSAGLAVSRNRASSGHCPSPSHTPCRLGPARAGPGGAGYREYGKHGGGGSGRARAGSAALCAAPGRAARGAGAPLCPRRAGGRGGKVAGRQGRWPSLTGR